MREEPVSDSLMLDAPSPDPPREPFRSVHLVALLALTLLVPLGVRLLPANDDPGARLPYLPAFEGKREHAFHAHRLEELRRLNPGYVVIGDSMAGTRIDERVLGPLAGRPVAPLLQAGSGPAFWYLALKNWVIASGIKPRLVFIFFRDTNLTDTMFRLDEQFRWSLDSVAGDREEELNAVVLASIGGPWHGVHSQLESIYHGDRARRGVEPAITRTPVTWLTSSRRGQAEILTQANARFGLDHLRVMEGADMAVDEGTLFDGDRSVLPLMLRDAARADLRLCFVRVQRRPVGGQPPRQSGALREYIGDLRAYLEAHGAILHDETGDPSLTLDMYSDGDHIARHARERYTRHFYERLRPLFAPADPPR